MRAAVGTAVALSVCVLGACQLIGGIGDIEQGTLDAEAQGDGPEAGTGDHTVPPADAGDARSIGDGTNDEGNACVLDSGTCLGPREVVGNPNGGQAYCDNGTLVGCGQANQPCCPGNGNGQGDSPDFCDLGLACAQGRCGPCGMTMQPCCLGDINLGCFNQGCCDPSGVCVAAGATCTNQLACQNALCGGANNCGHSGLPCCQGSVCTPLHACVNGLCQRCGDQGSPCCMGFGGTGECRQPNTVCTGAVCAPCGAPGQACCPGDQCQSGLQCDPKSDTCGASGSCGTCGGAGQSCCASSSCVPGDCCDPMAAACVGDGGTCKGGYLCIAGSCACGTSGHSCCNKAPGCAAGGCCDTMSLCHDDGTDCTAGVSVCSMGTCRACGAPGQPCCAGGACPNDVNGCTNGTCP